MEDLAMPSASGMFVKANNFPGEAALSLISGSASANTPKASASNNSSIRAEAMQEQGIGQNVDLSL